MIHHSFILLLHLYSLFGKTSMGSPQPTHPTMHTIVVPKSSTQPLHNSPTYCSTSTPRLAKPAWVPPSQPILQCIQQWYLRAAMYSSKLPQEPAVSTQRPARKTTAVAQHQRPITRIDTPHQSGTWRRPNHCTTGNAGCTASVLRHCTWTTCWGSICPGKKSLKNPIHLKCSGKKNTMPLNLP